MWSHCTFCTSDLGRNDVVETFPVGRRLAFDAAKGRLWVVCRRCAGWNLTPLEERWEAVEACESRFRATRTRLSTGELGLARLREGLELVRIGRPLRPEFAAWRYGAQFGRRRRRALLTGAALTAVGGAAYVGGLAAGGLGMAPLVAYSWWHRYRTGARLRTADGRLLAVRAFQLEHASLIAPERAGSGAPAWSLSVPCRGGRELFVGEEALLATSRLVRRINRAGARERTVAEAVLRIQAEGRPEGYLHALVRSRAAPSGPPEFFLADLRGREVGPSGWGPLGSKRVVRGSLARLETSERLALEMALHEDRERRAMEGELRILERAWKEAETIAEIADGLLPLDTPQGIERHDDGGGAG